MEFSSEELAVCSDATDRLEELVKWTKEKTRIPADIPVSVIPQQREATHHELAGAR